MLGRASAEMTLEVYAGFFGDDLDVVAANLAPNRGGSDGDPGGDRDLSCSSSGRSPRSLSGRVGKFFGSQVQAVGSPRWRPQATAAADHQDPVVLSAGHALHPTRSGRCCSSGSAGRTGSWPATPGPTRKIQRLVQSLGALASRPAGGVTQLSLMALPIAS
jgi:hypothetical protein